VLDGCLIGNAYSDPSCTILYAIRHPVINGLTHAATHGNAYAHAGVYGDGRELGR
jgi:hypothetical protein